MTTIFEITQKYDKIYKAGDMTNDVVLDYIKEIVAHSARLENVVEAMGETLQAAMVCKGVYQTLADFFSLENESYRKIFEEAQKASDTGDFCWGVVKCESCEFEWPGATAGRAERIECPQCKCMTPVPEEE